MLTSIRNVKFIYNARLAHKSSSKSAKRDRAPCLEARSAIVGGTINYRRGGKRTELTSELKGKQAYK